MQTQKRFLFKHSLKILQFVFDQTFSYSRPACLCHRTLHHLNSKDINKAFASYPMTPFVNLLLYPYTWDLMHIMSFSWYLVKTCTGQPTMPVLKACVHYFLSNLFFSLNDSPSNSKKNVFYFIYKALFVLEIFKFLYFPLPLFLSLSAIALEVDWR